MLFSGISETRHYIRLPKSVIMATESLPKADQLTPPVIGYRLGFGFFVIALMVTLSREPGWLADPRFWAEEGLIHFVNAFHNDFWAALTYVNVTGYFVLVANIATIVAAKLLPLELAAYGTLTVSAIIHALPALIIATAHEPNWSIRQRAVMALVTLLIGPSTESWLNTINSQFVLVVMASLLLITDHANRWWRYGACLLTPLASPVPAFLAPLFIARAALKQDRQRVIEAACYTLGTIAAASIAVWYSHNHVQTEAVDRLGKDLVPDMVAIAHVLAVKTTGFLIGGDWGSTLVYQWLTEQQQISQLTYGLFAFGLALPPFALGAWAALRRRTAFGLFSACGLITLLIMVFAGEGPATQLAPVAGRRYVFPINVLLMLTLVIGFWPKQSWRTAPLAFTGVSLSAVIIVINAVAFWLVPIGQQGPSWRAQAAAWREDPTQPVRFWPGVPGNEAAWSARLTPPVTDLPPTKTTDNNGLETRIMRWREEPVIMRLEVANTTSLSLDIIPVDGTIDGKEAVPVIIAQPRWQMANGKEDPLTLPRPAQDTLPHIGTEHYQFAQRLVAPITITIPVTENAQELTLAVGIDYRRPYRDMSARLRLTPIIVE